MDPCSKHRQRTTGNGCTGEREHESFQPRFQKPGHYFPHMEIGSRQQPTGLEPGMWKSAEPGTHWKS